MIHEALNFLGPVNYFDQVDHKILLNRYLKEIFSHFWNSVRKSSWDMSCFLNLNCISWERTMLEIWESHFEILWWESWWESDERLSHESIVKFIYQFEKMAWHSYLLKVQISTAVLECAFMKIGNADFWANETDRDG